MNRKTKYGWMALGGMLCLFGVVLACKARDGNRAVAQSEMGGPNKKEDKLVPLSERARELPPISESLPALKSTPETKSNAAPPPMPGASADQRPILIPASATTPVAAGPPPMS